MCRPVGWERVHAAPSSTNCLCGLVHRRSPTACVIEPGTLLLMPTLHGGGRLLCHPKLEPCVGFVSTVERLVSTTTWTKNAGAIRSRDLNKAGGAKPTGESRWLILRTTACLAGGTRRATQPLTEEQTRNAPNPTALGEKCINFVGVVTVLTGAPGRPRDPGDRLGRSLFSLLHRPSREVAPLADFGY